MLKVVYDNTEDLQQITMEGHAGYAERGKDIVCAGASAIAYSLLGFLENAEQGYEYKIREADGYMQVTCKNVSEGVLSAFTMAYIGLMQLAFNYPQHVSVKENKKN